MLPDINKLYAIVKAAADKEIMSRFANVVRSYKPDGSIVTDADHGMQGNLHAALAKSWPEYAFLGEEMSAAERQSLLDMEHKGLWCVDPLDGTSNFACGIPFFAVSVALIIDDKPRLAMVYDPNRDECFAAIEGQGATLNGSRLPAHEEWPPLQRAIAVIDFKRLPAAIRLKLNENPPYGSQRNFGASSLEWCWLAAGRFHAYLHGGQQLWDYAGGSLILAESGGSMTTLDGKPFFQGEYETSSVVAALVPDLQQQWYSWLRS